MKQGQSFELATDSFRNRTAYTCLDLDRFSYYLYYPKDNRTECQNLIVLIHGSERGAEAYRNQFKSFADEHNCAIVAPLFTAGYPEPTDYENYCFLSYKGIRYDLNLLSIVKQVRQQVAIKSERFLLHGFSGGGQFAHRFLYLYPEWLKCVSIGAPGRLTKLDESLHWPEGVRGMNAMFNKEIILSEIAKVSIQVIVGKDDTEQFAYTDGLRSRIDNCVQLSTMLELLGCRITFSVMPNTGHNGFEILNGVKDFFALHV